MSSQETEAKHESSVSFTNTSLNTSPSNLAAFSSPSFLLSPQASFTKDHSYIVHSNSTVQPYEEPLLPEESIEQEAEEKETFWQKTKHRAGRKIFSDLVPNSVLDWFSKENLVPQSSPAEAAKFSVIYLFPPMLVYQSLVAAMQDIYELYHENGKNFQQALKDYKESVTLAGTASKILNAAIMTVVLETTLAYFQQNDDEDLTKQISIAASTAAIEAFFSGILKSVEMCCTKDSKEKSYLRSIPEELAKSFFYSFLFSMFQINNIAESSFNLSKDWMYKATNALITGGSTYLASLSVASIGDVCRWATSKCSFFGGKTLTEDAKIAKSTPDIEDQAQSKSESEYVPPDVTITTP